MRLLYLQLSVATIAILLVGVVVPCSGKDYWVVETKDGQIKKVPLTVSPDQIKDIIRVESTPKTGPSAQPPSGPSAEQRKPEPAPPGSIVGSEAEDLLKEPPPSGKAAPPASGQAPLITRDSQTAPKKPVTSRTPTGSVKTTVGARTGELTVNMYSLPSDIKGLPDFSAFRPQRVLTTDLVNLNPEQGVQQPSGIPAGSQTIGMRFLGFFRVTGEGIFQWRVNSKDGVRLHIDDKTLIENDGIHNKPVSKSGYIHLGEGTHIFLMDTFNSSGKPVVQVFVTPPDGPEELFSASKGLTGWREPGKPYDVLWGQVYFVPKGKYPKGPDFSKISAVGRLITPDLNILGGNSFPGIPGKKDMIGVHYEGYFNVKGAGIFAYRLAADYFAKLTVGEHSVAQIVSKTKHKTEGDVGWVFLQEGSYPISVDYFHPRGEPQLQLFVTPPNAKEELFTPARPLQGYATDAGSTNMIPGFVYLLKEGTKKLPNYNKMDPSGMFFTQAIDYPVDRGTNEFPGVPKRDKWVGLRFYVKFSLSEQEKGRYKFRLVADDGARLIVGKKLVISVDSEGRGGTQEKSGSVTLPAGTHEMFIDYYQATGPSGVQLFITQPGEEEKIFAFQ